MKKLSASQEKHAIKLHNDAVIIDTHCDTLMQLIPPIWGQPPARSFTEKTARSHIDLPKMFEGGLTCQTFAMFTGTKAFVPEASQIALRMLAQFWQIVDRSDTFRVATNAQDILNTKKDGVVCGLLAIEGAEPLMGDVELIDIYYRLGVRMMSLAWNWRTPFADGLYGASSESMLTDLGVQAIEMMGELGIVFDVSHLADSVFWSACDFIDGTFIASHSNARKVCDHPRNLTDEMITALADHGGVMGINYEPTFVHKTTATIETLVDHIDHIANLVGPDHVGLGSDYDGITVTPKGLEDITKLPDITKELVRRGYPDKDVLNILGGNFLRVFKEILH